MYMIKREMATTTINGEKWLTIREANRIIRAGSYATLEKFLNSICIDTRFDEDGELIIRYEDAKDIAEAKRRIDGDTTRWARSRAFGIEYCKVKALKRAKAQRRQPMTVDEMIAEQKRLSIERYHRECDDFYAHQDRDDNRTKWERARRMYAEIPTQHNNLKANY